MPERSARISIIIPNLHCPVVDQVLEALHAQESDLSRVEVVVVGLDRHQLVHKDELIRPLSTETPVPPAKARNLGAASASGETLIFLDADCVPQPGWLEAMLEAQTRWPDAGAISGSMLPDADTFRLHCGQVASFHEHLNLNPPGRRHTLASFSLLVLRDVWEEAGGFDDQMQFAAAEDLDFSLRIAHRGYPLYFEPRAVVRHLPGRGSWRSLYRHAFRSGTQSILVRQRYADSYQMPGWALSSWSLLLLSPGIALVRAAQIYTGVPGLFRHWRCAPWVILSKLAWCWGAAAELARSR